MKVIIPASGTGERFIAAGYEKTKPLIDVNSSIKIIDYVINCFDKENDEFFIITSGETYDVMDEYLSSKQINYKHILYTGEKLGPVGAIYYSVSELTKYIREGDQIIVSYCDYGMVWDYNSFLSFIRDNDPDGCIPCYKGYHPHLENPQNVYAACKVFDGSNRIFDVKEKYESNNRLRELWSAGLYYFKSFALMLDAFKKNIENKDTLNEEYYVSIAYNYILEKNILVYDKIRKFYQFGTPDDFEYAKSKLTMLENFDNEVTNIENIVILSAGKGERFLNLDFKQPKPFLPLGDSFLVDNIKKTFDNNSDNIRFVGSRDHSLFWENSNLNVTYVKPNKIGAAYSYKESCSDINGEALIVPCDLIAKHITPLFKKLKETADVIIFTADPTDYSEQHPDSFAWVSGSNNSINEISIKKKIKKEKSQMVLIGSFWVRSNDLLIKHINRIFESKFSVNGEYYLDNAFKDMLDVGITVNYIKLDKYFSFGTPEEYNDSKYWLDEKFNER